MRVQLLNLVFNISRDSNLPFQIEEKVKIRQKGVVT